MYLKDYLFFTVAILICLIFSAVASGKVSSAFRKYDKVKSRRGFTGYDTATCLMRRNGVYDISVGLVGGELSDHYHPTKKVVNLSQSTYSSSSVAAIAVAAHEIGHVMQKKDGYAV